MDKITINSLLQIDEEENITVDNIQKNNFDVDRIINRRKEKEKKLKQEYENLYQRCLNNIEKYDRMNKNFMLYKLPEKSLKNNNYSINDCYNYIKERIEKHYMDVYKYSKNVMYISWENIEENRSKGYSSSQNKNNSSSQYTHENENKNNKDDNEKQL